MPDFDLIAFAGIILLVMLLWQAAPKEAETQSAPVDVFQKRG